MQQANQLHDELNSEWIKSKAVVEQGHKCKKIQGGVPSAEFYPMDLADHKADEDQYQ